MLLASDRTISATRMVGTARAVDPQLGPLAENEAALLGEALTGGDVYTDDKSPVEWLIDRSIVEYAAGG
ncbi:MAG: hypothetical protein WAP35_00005 [Solirubrobacterales bacterium]